MASPFYLDSTCHIELPTSMETPSPNDSNKVSEKDESQAKELAREFRVAEKWVIGTNIVLAIIGIFALCIYNGQLRVMRGQLTEIIKQYPELQKSADAAKISADIAQHSFEMEKRRAEDTEEAECRPSGDIAVGNTSYRFFILNSGKVDARDISGHFELSLNRLPSNKRAKLLSSFDVSEDKLRGQNMFTKNISIDIGREWEKLINTQESLVLTGQIKYDNGFDRQRRGTTCDVLVWFPSPNDPLNRAHGSGVDCDRFPEWFANQEKMKAH